MTRIDLLIDKITRLHETLPTERDSISSIDRDLMLKYLTELYEEFRSLTSEAHSVLTEKKKTKSAPEPVVAEVEEPLDLTVSKMDPVIEQPKPKAQEPAKVELPKTVEVPKTPQQPKIELPKPVVESNPISTPNPINKEVVAEKLEPKKEKTKTSGGALGDLFEEEEATDLVHQLANAKITDLISAMGINERQLTVNELFEGDNGAFLEAVGALQTLRSFGEARSFLEQRIAPKFEWTNPDRLKKAKHFIATIRRLYS